MSGDLSVQEHNILCNLDNLLQLIKDCTRDGKHTKVKEYQRYYDEVRVRPKIKELIKGTVHEIPSE